jgi:hypothetical protein
MPPRNETSASNTDGKGSHDSAGRKASRVRQRSEVTPDGLAPRVIPEEPVVQKHEEHEQRADSDREDGHEPRPAAQVSSFQHRSNDAPGGWGVKPNGGSVACASVREWPLASKVTHPGMRQCSGTPPDEAYEWRSG